MTKRRWLVVGLVLTAMLAFGCGKKESSGSKDKGASGMSAADAEKAKAELKANLALVQKQCEQLGKACNKEEKHQKEVAKGCLRPAEGAIKAGCLSEVTAVLKCFEKDICGAESVQVYDDFRVLTRRHKKCFPELKAVFGCMKKDREKKGEK